MKGETCLWSHTVNYFIMQQYQAWPCRGEKPPLIEPEWQLHCTASFFSRGLWDGLYSIEKRQPECLLLLIFDLQPCVCGWLEDEGLGMCLADDGVEKWIVVSLSFKCTYSPAPALGSSWGMQPCLTLKAVTGGVLLFSRDSVIFRMKIHSCLASAHVLPRCLILLF